jgi:hypothetical protein
MIISKNVKSPAYKIGICLAIVSSTCDFSVIAKVLIPSRIFQDGFGVFFSSRKVGVR